MKYIFFEVSSVRLKIIFSYFLSIFLSWKLCIIMMMWVWFDRGGGRGRYGLKITLRYLQDISWYITCIEWVKYPNIFDQIPRSWYCDTICRHDYWYFYKMLTQWDFLINNHHEHRCYDYVGEGKYWNKCNKSG